MELEEINIAVELILFMALPSLLKESQIILNQDFEDDDIDEEKTDTKEAD